jgi:hypothetical protein
MSIQSVTIVGVLCSDPLLPLRMYLTEEGDLTRHIKKAKHVDNDSVDLAVKEVSAYSPKTFHIEVAI